MNKLDLYTLASQTYTGAKDTGNGTGPDGPGFGFPDAQAYAAPPGGILLSPIGWWSHGSSVYLVSTTRIDRYTVSAGVFTWQDYVLFADLGFAGSKFADDNFAGCAFYDSTAGDVVLLSEPTSGTGNTPIAKCWPMSAWPFNSSNHKWASPLQQSYGSYAVGQLARSAIGLRSGGKLYLASQYCTQVITLDCTDGAVLGVWTPYTAYGTTYPFRLIGVSGNYAYGGSHHASAGDKDLCKWDISTPGSWSKVSTFYDATDYAYSAAAPAARRVYLYSSYYQAIPVSDNGLALAGLSGLLAWWLPSRYLGWGEPILHLHDLSADKAWELPFANTSSRRAVGNCNLAQAHAPGFIEVDGYPWLISFSQHTQDIEEANPGGSGGQQIGLVLTPLGPVVTEHEWTPAYAASPKQVVFEVPSGVVNYLGSDSLAKNRARVWTGTDWSAWKEGAALGDVSDWPDLDPATPYKVQHGQCAGWPYTWAGWRQNPGAGGDPEDLPVPSADIAPPRDVRIGLWVDPSLPDAGKTFGRPRIVSGSVIKPTIAGGEFTP